MGDALHKLDKHIREEGLQLSEGILALYPDYWPSLDTKGWALYKQGKYEEAMSFLNDAWEHKTVIATPYIFTYRKLKRPLPIRIVSCRVSKGSKSQLQDKYIKKPKTLLQNYSS